MPSPERQPHLHQGVFRSETPRLPETVKQLSLTECLGEVSELPCLVEEDSPSWLRTLSQLESPLAKESYL